MNLYFMEYANFICGIHLVGYGMQDTDGKVQT